jgi:hypothetical protein
MPTCKLRCSIPFAKSATPLSSFTCLKKWCVNADVFPLRGTWLPTRVAQVHLEEVQDLAYAKAFQGEIPSTMREGNARWPRLAL